MPKIDFKKELNYLYAPSAKEMAIACDNPLFVQPTAGGRSLALSNAHDDVA